MKRPLSIVYMGTPDFAVPPLKALIAHGHTVLAVVTQPDRPKGRGRRLVPPPVKDAALELGLSLIQLETVRTNAFHQKMRDLSPDLMVVTAFGQILPPSLLDIPKMGAINIHASLLPRYRGPAPIQWAIIRGETQTGITTMMMDQGVDTGDILLAQKTPIRPWDTAQTLHDRLSQMGAETLIQTLDAMADGMHVPIPQDPAKATWAPLLTKEDGRINWSLSADRIDRQIRGLFPWPGAFTFYEGMRLKIYKAHVVSHDLANTEAAPGTLVQCHSGSLYVATGKGILAITEIQGKSGKRLGIDDFLCGCRLVTGTCMG
ncbi:methionyl-tRNA formyltransferase [Desulfosarcina sp. OttesenSCG-928-A07]|nr:methionyl-tRNA formyltransferase [Desulfosarcina sp. OttesenSCG-928-G17]MDL2329816.1 methionyl-tRNA formyltransferase [Desulfosarcina sp. OttesenSCG-928-A07]